MDCFASLAMTVSPNTCLAPLLRLGARSLFEREHDVAETDWTESDVTLRALLVDVLGLDAERIAGFEETTELFGALPEFDSMAVATLLTGIEERFGVLIEDDDVEAEDFASFGTLLAFVRRKALV